MGTWGSGILQNDAAQDGLVEAAHEVRDALQEMVDTPIDDDWPRLFAGVGLLMQFSPYTLDPENEDSRIVARAIELHRAGGAAGAKLDEVFDAICAGRTPDYEMATFEPDLQIALHGPNDGGFPMQKTWAKAPERCFAFPRSKTFVQEFADQRVERIQEEFADEDLLQDLCRESGAMGDFALLLILDGIHVDPALFVGWRDAWRDARDHDESEAEFFVKYYACVEAGFEYAIQRFALP